MRRVFPSRRAPLTPLARLAFSLGRAWRESPGTLAFTPPRFTPRLVFARPARHGERRDLQREQRTTGLGFAGDSLDPDETLREQEILRDRGAKEEQPSRRRRREAHGFGAAPEEGRVACCHETGERLRAATQDADKKQFVESFHGLTDSMEDGAPANGWFLEGARNQGPIRSTLTFYFLALATYFYPFNFLSLFSSRETKLTLDQIRLLSRHGLLA